MGAPPAPTTSTAPAPPSAPAPSTSRPPARTSSLTPPLTSLATPSARASASTPPAAPSSSRTPSSPSSPSTSVARRFTSPVPTTRVSTARPTRPSRPLQPLLHGRDPDFRQRMGHGCHRLCCPRRRSPWLLHEEDRCRHLCPSLSGTFYMCDHLMYAPKHSSLARL